MKKALYITLKLLIALLVIAFVARALGAHWGEVAAQAPLLWAHAGWVAASFLALGVNFLLLAKGWSLILDRMGSPIGLLPAFKILSYSQLGKYVPGKLWIYLGRVYWCALAGVDKRRSIASSLLETAMQILSGCLLFCFAFALGLAPAGKAYLWIGLASSAFFLVLIHPRVFFPAANAFLTRTGREPISSEVGFGELLKILVFYEISWLVMGAAIFLLARAVTDVPLWSIPFLGGALAVAGTAGILCLFAPGGLGVREGVLSLLLAGLVGPAAAVWISILSRFWLTVAELAAMAVSAPIRIVPATPSGARRAAPLRSGEPCLKS